MKYRYIFIREFKIVIICLVILSVSSCGKFDLFKDMSESLPVVEMVTIESHGDTTIVVGKIVEEGVHDVSLCGFCYSSSGTPAVDDNQILIGGTDGEFGVMILDLWADSIYYFSAFAYNDYAYAVSNPLQYTIPSQGPPDVPCIIDNNLIIDNGIHSTINNIYAGQNPGVGGLFGINILYKNSNNVLDINFMVRPVNGIYTTDDITSVLEKPRKVYVTLKSGIMDLPVKNNGLIYVEELDDDLFAVTFCELIYTAFSSEFTLAGKIVVEVK